jgi:E3 ubiquitin-protein ligase MARCH6
MAFELAVFPIMCGVALDLATISFFQEASITSRLEFTKFAPLSSLFFHWLVGTIYM